MKVSDIMTRDVFAVAPDTSIETAARLLTTKHISGVPVVEEDGRPVGVVSLVDLADPDRNRSDGDAYPLFYRFLGGEPLGYGAAVKVGGGRVDDVMSPFVLTIDGPATLTEAAETMVSHSVHRLLVLEGRKLAGIVTSMDLLRGFVDGK